MLARSTSHTSSHQDHDTLSLPSERSPGLHHSISGLSNRSQSRLSYHRPSCQQEECEHGLYSPHASRPNSSSSVRYSNTNDPSEYTPTHLSYVPQPSEGIENTESGNGGAFGGRKAGETDLGHGLLGDAVTDGILGAGGEEDGEEDGGGGKGVRAKWKGAVQGMSTTQWLARRHGIRGRRLMYVPPTLTQSSLIGRTDADWKFAQVSGILLPLSQLDHAIPLVLSTR